MSKHSNKENSVLAAPHNEGITVARILFLLKIFSIISSMGRRSHVVIVNSQDKGSGSNISVRRKK
jgi:hypothetical protein